MTNNENIIRVLMETRRLLEGKGWNKYTMARDTKGHLCSPDSQDAACYCLSGALVKAWRTIDPGNEEFYFPYFEKKISEVLLEKYNYPYTYTRWNDNVATCREDVIKLIHLVITSVLTDSEVRYAAYETRKFAA
ncbi:DUF6197 family protein [Methylocapsa palsarum]|uniref:Uncharacterized protein n=1 Tax=Methylocapsa palsarum TaxID=1612308 RepID=A0A1I4C6P2_9HYPH|nr:hypothetical protein [Methylocapsa palsarum]SFK75826.1 hypothetical protein SAMN05444581_11833 [Methylocapsa palsarum]